MIFRQRLISKTQDYKDQCFKKVRVGNNRHGAIVVKSFLFDKGTGLKL